MKEYEIIAIKFQLKSFSWADGLYAIIGIVENGTCYELCKLESNFELQKFDDGKLLTCVTGINNKGITRTNLKYVES